jgi:O-acetylhomoserine/O-acetylserine sulfhydrylase-like pyridoxal-dependent enzyme
MDTKHAKFATKAVHAGQMPDPETGALVAPMFMTSTYVWTPEKMDRYLAGDKEGIFTYARSRNPPRTTFRIRLRSSRAQRRRLLPHPVWRPFSLR